jgi:hypothetical protein
MRTFSLTALAAVLCWCLPARAGAPPKLVEARTLIDDLELDAALKALAEAEKVEGNDRAAVLEIYLLQGIAFGTLGKDAKTRDAFRKLLMLDPAAKLPADQPPRVRTPFFEAREWVAANGPLTATAEAVSEDGLVKRLAITLQKDVLRQVRTARVHWRTSGPEEVVELPITAGTVAAPVSAPSVTWWVELLSDKRAVVVELGTAASPRQDPPPVAAAVVSPPAPREEPAPVAQVETRPVSGGWRRPTGFVLLGAGAVAAGVGAVFGVQAGAARASLAGAARDAEGRITGLTQVDYAAREAQANSQATLANVLFGVGGALGAAGLVFVILGPVTEPVVALSPTPGGAVLRGSF